MNIQWPDVTARNAPRCTFVNALKAIEAMNLSCWTDDYNQLRISGRGIEIEESHDALERIVRRLRLEARLRVGFDPGEKQMEDAILLACEQGSEPPDPWE